MMPEAMRFSVIGCILVIVCLQSVDSMDVQNLHFLEKFAYSDDRKSAVADLLPGSDDFYFYSGLLALQVDRLEEAKAALSQWTHSGRGLTSDYEELEKRIWLAQWDAGEEKLVAAFLKKDLQLVFNHSPSRRIAFGGESTTTNELFSILPDFAVSMESLLEHHFSELGFSDISEFVFPYVAQKYPERALQLVETMTWPSIPDIARLINDLKVRGDSALERLNSLHGIGNKFTLYQLQALKTKKIWPWWLYKAYAGKLLPLADLDMSQNDAAYEKWLDHLKPLVDNFPPGRAKVLYARMELSLRKEEVNANLLLEYLRTIDPQPRSYMKRTSLETEFPSQRYPYADVPPVLSPYLPNIHDDEIFVRDYLIHIFSSVSVTAEAAQRFLQSGSDQLLFNKSSELALFWSLLTTKFLSQCVAEAKLLNGDGDQEIWLEILNSEKSALDYERLSNPELSRGEALSSRISLDFAESNPKYWTVEAPVYLDIFIKNVPQLIVKVFEIDLLHYFRDKDVDEVDPQLDLDGLTPGHQRVEQTNVWADTNRPLPPLRRVRHRLEFPHLHGKRGCFIVELMGNGRSSRAILYKGRLRAIQRHSAAGHLLRIVREDGSLASREACVFVDGKEYRQDQSLHGEVLIPFATTSQKSKRVVLTDGDLSSVDYFQQKSELYSLSGKFWLDEWSLVPGEDVKLIVSVALLLDGGDVPLSLLERPLLRITWVNRDGIRTVQTVKSLNLRADEDLVHTLKAPNEVLSLDVAVSGFVKQVSRGGEEQELSTSKSWAFPQFQRGPGRTALHLVRTAEGFFVRVLGLSGEPKPGVVLEVKLRAWFLREGYFKSVTLITDQSGTVKLGQLLGITELQAVAMDRETDAPLERSWMLDEMKTHSWRPTVIQGKSGIGEVLRVPYNPSRLVWPGGKDSRQNRYKGAALFARNQGGFYVRRVTEKHIQHKNGYLELTSLPPGDYKLFLADRPNAITVHIIKSTLLSSQSASDTQNLKDVSMEGEMSDFVFGNARMGELTDPSPLVIQRVEETKKGVKDREAGKGGESSDGLAIQLMGSNPKTTRVHVWLTHMVNPSIISHDEETSAGNDPFLSPNGNLKSHYLTGRILGDEVRYVLNRRESKKRRIGNMLSRPSLLLHPWAQKTTENLRQAVSEGDSSWQMQPMSVRDQSVALSDSGGLEGSIEETRFGEKNSFSRSRTNFRPLFAPQTVVLSNLKPNEAGEVFIPNTAIPGSQTLARIVAVDNSLNRVWASHEFALSPRDYDFKSVSNFFRPVALTRGLAPEKRYSQRRSISVLSKGERIDVADKTTAQIQYYDTLEKAWRLMESLLTSYGDQAKWQDFVSLTSWQKLSQKDKRNMVKKYGSHELHVFLLFKDPTFFETHVRPSLESKMDRSFVDHWLLADHQEVTSWATRNPKDIFELLNAFERSLLVWSLMKTGLQDIAEAVVKEERHVATKETKSPEDRDRLFGIALRGGIFEESYEESSEEESAPSPPSSSDHTKDDSSPHTRSDYGSSHLEAADESSTSHLVSMSNEQGEGSSMSGIDEVMQLSDVVGESERESEGESERESEEGPVHDLPDDGRAGLQTQSMTRAFKKLSRTRDLLLRETVEQRYRPTETTKEYVETHYYKESLEDESGHTLPPNAFWSDFSGHVLHEALENPETFKQKTFPSPFLSENLAEAGGTFTSSILALAVLDLPFSTPLSDHSSLKKETKEGLQSAQNTLTSERHLMEVSGSTMTFAPSWPLILFSQQIEESPPPPATFQPPFSVQHLLLESSEDQVQGGVQNPKLLAHGTALEAGKCYCFRAFVISMTSAAQNLRVLLQIPEGSVPVHPFGIPTLATPITVPPYGHTSTDIHFYFPAPGNYTQFPVHVSTSTANQQGTENGDMERDFEDGTLLAVAQGLGPHVEVISQEEMRRRVAQEREKKGWGKGAEVWKDLCEHGSSAAVVTYIMDGQMDIRRKDFTYILWRLRNYTFFRSLTNILRARLIFDEGVWSYSLYHEDMRTMAEYIPACLTRYLSVPIVESKLLTLDVGPTQSYLAWVQQLQRLNAFEYREFTPLVNPRAHCLQRKKEGASGILNSALEEQYSAFLRACSRRKRVEGLPAIQATYYLLLQERIEDAQEMFGRINLNFTESKRLHVQVDYLRAYLDMATSPLPVPTVAKEVSLKYKDCGLIEWQDKFKELSDQLAEIESTAQPNTANTVVQEEQDVEGEGDDSSSRIRELRVAPEDEPNAESHTSKGVKRGQEILELNQESGELWVTSSHVDSIKLSVYVMDIELMFSVNPFVKNQNAAFSYVAPNWASAVHNLTSKSTPSGRLKLDIPDEFQAKNVLVEVSGGGIRRTVPRYSDAGLVVEVSENRGELRAMHRAASSSKSSESDHISVLQSAYVKVYARFHGGAVQFYKDGYTDRRGKFDYVSLSTDELPKVERFAVLVISDDHGAVIREAAPPAL